MRLRLALQPYLLQPFLIQPFLLQLYLVYKSPPNNLPSLHLKIWYPAIHRQLLKYKSRKAVTLAVSMVNSEGAYLFYFLAQDLLLYQYSILRITSSLLYLSHNLYVLQAFLVLLNCQQLNQQLSNMLNIIYTLTLTYNYYLPSPPQVIKQACVMGWTGLQIINFIHFITKMYQRQKQSPYRSIEYQSLEHSKQTAIKKIETVFTYFAGKASKYNYQELHQKYFTELATHLFRLARMQSEITLSSKRWLAITTLYYTKGRNKPLYFSQFLELLPGLAKTLFSQGSSLQVKATEKQQEAGMKSLLLLFEKIYYIIRDEEIEKKSLQAEDIMEDTKEFLLKLRESLVKIYKIYFQYETNLKDKSKDYQLRSFENFIELMKDFDIFPKLISASQLYYIYNEVLEDHEHYHLSLLSPSISSKTAFPKLGQHFTLTRLILGLILASHVCVSKLKRVQGQELLFCNTGLSQKQSIKLLLEYMQTVRSVKSKMCKFSLQRFSLIVYEQYADYTSKAKESAYSSPAKTSRYKAAQQKKSFFDIMHNLNI